MLITQMLFFSIDIWEPSITSEQLFEFANQHGIGWAVLMGSNSNIDDDYEVEECPHYTLLTVME